MKIKAFFEKTVKNYKIIIVILVLFSVAASVQSIVRGTKTYSEGGREYNCYNNYTIFKQSYFHLKNDQDIYKLYEEEHWDIYKYSPTFAVLFAPLAELPDAIGLHLWNLLNALILLLGVYCLPKLTNKQKGLILIASLIELMTSMQNEQSNGMIAGLIILTFALLERKKLALATLIIVFSVYIKLFGLVAFALFLFYPEKWKSILYSILWFVILFFLPLIVISMNQLLFLYESWGDMLLNDHSSSFGQLSVMGWFYTWFGITWNKIYFMFAGAVIFLIPFIKFKLYNNFNFKLLALSSILLWIVIFNHKSESPTFIIAMAGASLWFFTQEKSLLNIILFVSAFILTSLSPTDIFPRYLRNEFVIPYVLKAVPCIFIWMKIIYDMMTIKQIYLKISK